ncbi:MAG TPA: amidohydrolase family protein [Vicinamibacterales bacterium]|jgi:imidazolonepropionase-like amidohydrolase
MRTTRVLLVLAPLLAVSGPVAPAQTRALALVGGTIYADPAAPPLRNGLVLIRDGTIAAVGTRGAVQVPNGAETIDCSGLTIAAGFWNSHVHFTERKWANAARIGAPELASQLQAMLTRYGFTSVFDTGSMWENTKRIRDRIESGEVAGPRIRSTGEILEPPGGAPPDLVLDITGAMHVTLPEVASAAEARAAARALLDAGVDGIKLYAQTWAPPIVVMPPDAVRGAVDEAHRRGKPVFAHPSNRDGLLNAVRSGVDVIVHTTPQMGPWNGAVLDELVAARVTLIPTLKLWRYELRHDRESIRDGFAAVGVGQLRAWRERNGAVIFGTDVGYMNDYDPTEEYVLMAQAGMTSADILASLTTAPAGRFGAASRAGRVAAGLDADVVVLAGDPAADVRAFAAVRYSIRGGRVLYAAPSPVRAR